MAAVPDVAPRPSAGPHRTPGAGTVRRRLPLMVLGVVCLLGGLWGGLLLLGLSLPAGRPSTAADHGVLMALGFLGTVIALERAVALRRMWAYGAPAAAGAGGLAMIVGLPDVVGWALLCVAAVVFVVVYAVALRIQPMFHLRVMAAGAVCWYLAAVLWLGGYAVPRIVPWLAGFLVFTILGERLDLARFVLLTKRSVRLFAAGSAAFGVGLVLSTIPGTITPIGIRVAGVGLIVFAVWGAQSDIARRTIRTAGLTRFMASALFAGYAWLAAGGIIWLATGDLAASSGRYDAALHAIFLGFVMSMIFAHAPVIVPAVLRVNLPYARAFYVHLGLLHAALLVRLIPGDAFGNQLAWQVGGIGTEVAVLLFVVVSAAAVLLGRNRPRSRVGPPLPTPSRIGAPVPSDPSAGRPA